MSAARLETAAIVQLDIDREPAARALFVTEAEARRDKIDAPVDPLTRMPLPVLPPRRRLNPRDPKNNWHHHYHPAKSDKLRTTNGLPVRHSRLQLLPEVEYHNAYHGIFYGPEWLPWTNEQRFGHIVLAAAGYIPRFALDIKADDPSVPTEMTPAMRQRLQRSGEIVLHGEPNIATFMKNHLVKQDFSHVDDLVIEEFLHSPDIERRFFLGHWLLAIASEIAAEPINPIYRQALDEGLIAEKTSKPPNLAKKFINGRKQQRKALQALRKQLVKQFQV